MIWSLELRLYIIQVAMKLHTFFIIANYVGLGDLLGPELELLIGKGTPGGNCGYLLSGGRHDWKFSELKVKDFFISKWNNPKVDKDKKEDREGVEKNTKFSK